MPGGKKNSQRTKGNTRPSSSGRSAQKLLQNVSSHDLTLAKGNHLGFVGFDSSTVSSTDDFDSPLLDDSCRMLLKKMTKKDATTKLKALQEFKSYCGNCTDEALRTALPYWPRLYNKLCLDGEKRIREATSVTHSLIIDKVKKNFAPYLKSVIGYWMISMNDVYAPAASAAQSAFENSFSATKQTDVLVFCKEEILELIKGYLFNLTLQSLKDGESIPVDELEDNYERIVACTMLAFVNLIQKLPSQENENLIKVYEEIVTNNQFWKYGNHKSPLIKGAWLKVLSAFAHTSTLEVVLSPHLNKLATQVFSNLDESDVAVGFAAWEACLQIITTFPDCWKFLNVKKNVLPKLRNTLKHGCFGNASRIATCLLPFVSELIKQMDWPFLDTFYEDLFNDFREGLEVRSLCSSFSEYTAFITAFMECFKYVLIELIRTKPLRASNLLISQLFPVIEKVLSSPITFSRTAATFYVLLTNLLRYVHNRSSFAEEAQKEFQHIEQEFWKTFSEKYAPILTNYENPNITVLENLSVFLRCMANDKSASGAKTGRKIRFEESPPSERTGSEEKTTDLLVTNDNSPLNQFLSLCCEKSMFGYTSDHRSLVHLKFLANIFSAYSTQRLVRILMNGDETSEEKKCCSALYFEKIQNFIVSEKRKEDSSLIFSSLVITIINILNEHDDALKILKDVCLTSNNAFLLEALTRQLAGTNFLGKVHGEWLQSSEFTGKMLEYAKMLLNENKNLKNERESAWKLIISFVTVQHGCETSEKLTFYILNQVNSAIISCRQPKKSAESIPTNEFDYIYKLLAEFMKLNTEIHRIVYLLFQILTRCAVNDELLDKTWVDSLHDLLINNGIQVFVTNFQKTGATSSKDVDCLKNCADFVRMLVLNGNHSVDQMTSLKNWQQSWIHLVTDGNTNVLGTSWDILLSIVPAQEEWMDLTQHLYRRVYQKLLFRRKLPLSVEFRTDKRKILKNDHSVIVLANYTLNMMELFTPNSLNEKYLDSMLGLLAVTGYCKILSDKDSKNEAAENWLKRSKQFVSDVLESDVCEKLLSTCLELAQTSNYIWTETFSHLLSVNKKAYSITEGLISIEKMSGSYTMLGAFLPYKTNMAPSIALTLIEEINQLQAQTPLNGEFVRLRIGLNNLTLSELDKRELMLKLTDTILSFRETNDLFAVNFDVNDKSLIFNMADFVGLMCEVVSRATDISAELWDFILCSLGTWINVCCENRTSDVPICVDYWRFQVFCLLDAVASRISRLVENEKNDKLIVEWREFFANRLFHPILNLFVDLTAGRQQLNDYVLESLVMCFQNIPASSIENNDLPPKLVLAWDEKDKVIPNKIKYLLNSVCPLLISTRREFRVCAFLILKRITSSFPSYLQLGNLPSNVSSDDDDDDILTNWYFPGAFVDVLTRASDDVNVILSDLPFGQQIELESNDTLYTKLHGYLLTANLLFAVIGCGSSEWKTRWASALRKSGILHQLANHLFAVIRDESQDNFATEPVFDLQYYSPRRNLENLACFVYLEAVRRLPVLIREWWNSLDRKSSTYVDKITSRFVTPKIIVKDFNAIAEVKKLDNLSLLARPIAREVVATYTVEEVSFDLTVQLADNHPLGPVNIQCNRCVGVPKSQWNFWMLQLTTSITQRNGSILDALVLWKCHVDRMFEGVEECFVCYTILGANFQLPKLLCNTCKKKFHSSCLFKWFNTSGHSTCPLCRSIF